MMNTSIISEQIERDLVARVYCMYNATLEMKQKAEKEQKVFCNPLRKVVHCCATHKVNGGCEMLRMLHPFAHNIEYPSCQRLYRRQRETQNDVRPKPSNQCGKSFLWEKFDWAGGVGNDAEPTPFTGLRLSRVGLSPPASPQTTTARARASYVAASRFRPPPPQPAARHGTTETRR